MSEKVSVRVFVEADDSALSFLSLTCDGIAVPIGGCGAVLDLIEKLQKHLPLLDRTFDELKKLHSEKAFHGLFDE
jgi:hypothetical protein